MTDREAFVAAVVAQPDDDTVRLVFADWLDENGEPDRAEFVRVQVELARMPHLFAWDWPDNRASMLRVVGREFVVGPYRGRGLLAVTPPPGASMEDVWVDLTFRGVTYTDLLMTLEPAGDDMVQSRFRPHPRGPYPNRARRAELLARERELFRSKGVSRFLPERFGALLTLRLAERYDPTDSPAALLRRGFVESVTCSADDWLRHGDAVVKAQPVRAVTLTTPILPLMFSGGGEFDGSVWRLPRWKGVAFGAPGPAPVVVAECHRCGSIRPGHMGSDPFLEEVHDELTEPAWWCSDCYRDRVEDI